MDTPDAYASLLASALAWVCATSASLSAVTFLGLAVWFALRPPPSAGAVLGQWAIGACGTVLCVAGLAFFGGLIELAVGTPRAYSGAGSVLAYWVGFRLATYDAAARAAQLERLETRAAAGWRVWALTICAGCSVVERLLRVIVVIVAMGMTSAWYAAR